MSAPTSNSTANRDPRGCGEDFRHRAACRGVDPEVFFPTAQDGPQLEEQVAAAKAVCARCLVRSECLAWALMALPYGVAGGLTEDERHGERTRRGPGRSCGARQRPVNGTVREVAAAGRAAIRAGSMGEVAREFGVSLRTAARWAATARTTTTTSNSTSSTEMRRAEGSRGGNRAPLLVSQQRNPLAGTRAVEGHRG
jgi:hypothetical protein